jgi:hypothetical protein
VVPRRRAEGREPEQTAPDCYRGDVVRGIGAGGLQPSRSRISCIWKCLAGLFVVSRPIAQFQRLAGVGFRGPIKPPRCSYQLLAGTDPKAAHMGIFQVKGQV